jgi:hypothetical protein
MGSTAAAIKAVFDGVKSLLELFPYPRIFLLILCFIAAVAIFLPARYQGPEVYFVTRHYLAWEWLTFLFCGFLTTGMSVAKETEWHKQKSILRNPAADERQALGKFLQENSLTCVFMEGERGPHSLLEDKIVKRATDSHEHGAPQGFFYYTINRRAFNYFKEHSKV